MRYQVGKVKNKVLMALTVLFVPGGIAIVGGILIYKGIKKLKEKKNERR